MAIKLYLLHHFIFTLYPFSRYSHTSRQQLSHKHGVDSTRYIYVITSDLNNDDALVTTKLVNKNKLKMAVLRSQTI